MLTAHDAPPSTWHRPLLVCAAIMGVSTIVSGIGLLVDDRVLTGDPIWLKPAKFAISIGIYSLTWSWLFSLLRRWRRLAHRVSTALVAVAMIEYAIIVTQVLRGTTSHFNFSTPLNTTLFAIMGVSIAALWTGTLVLTVLLLRTPIADAASRWAVRLGAVIALAGLALGGLMLGPTPQQSATLREKGFSDVIGAHSVGAPDDGPGMPITGWSTTGGDLRIPHFVGMHALQVLPLLVLGLDLLARRWPRLRNERVRTRLVLVAGGSYTGLVALVTWQALRGQPLIAFDSKTTVAAVALLAATAAGIVSAVRGRRNTATPSFAHDPHPSAPASAFASGEPATPGPVTDSGTVSVVPTLPADAEPGATAAASAPGTVTTPDTTMASAERFR